MLGGLQRLSRAHFMPPGDSRLRALIFGYGDRNRLHGRIWRFPNRTLPPAPLEAALPELGRSAQSRPLYPVRVRDDRLRSLWTICSVKRRFARALAADTLLRLYARLGKIPSIRCIVSLMRTCRITTMSAADCSGQRILHAT